MPGPRRFDPDQRAAIRAELVARVAAGATVKAACGWPGMPCQETVNGWMRADPEFAAEMARARGRAGWVKRGIVPEDVGRAIVAGLAAGGRIEDVLRAPGMPSYRVYMEWRRRQAWFAGAVKAVLDSRAEERRLRLRRRRRAYDPAVGERIYLRLWKGATLAEALRPDPAAPDVAFPSRGVLGRWRREAPEFDRMLRFAMTAWRKKGRGKRRLTPELQAAVVEALVMGASLRSLGRRPDMPSSGTLYAWVRDCPAFARAVAQACVWREDWYAEGAMEAMERARGTKRALRAAAAPWVRQEVRLRKRPGWARARAEAGLRAAAEARAELAACRGRPEDG